MPETRKRKIAVLGGGVGSLCTAFFLTDKPGWQELYDITVYQMGWRLGGKGACGRNADHSERIEEHGPHVWFGFYQTAFQMLDACYDYCRQHNLTPESPFQRCIPDAMRPKNDSTVMEFIQGIWKAWHVTLPAHEGEPFNPPAGLIAQLIQAVEWLIGIRVNLQQRGALQSTSAKRTSPSARGLDRIYRFALTASGRSHLRSPVPVTQQTILGRIRELLHHMDEFLGESGFIARILLWLADKVASQLLRSLSELVKDEFPEIGMLGDDIRHLLLLLDLGIANLRGCFEDHILLRGFESINGKDYSDWLAAHGSRSPWSPLVQGLYDTCFAFTKGDAGQSQTDVKPASASMEAGATLRGMLLLFFGYNGSYCYKMQSGMGDTIFTPLYLTLQHRGVKFQFFHQITKLTVNDSSIDSIAVNVQASVRPESASPEGEYSPLKKVKGLLCWPNEPFYDQLIEGDQIKANHVDLESCWSGWTGTSTTLRRGHDYDDVVLGISLGMLPAICQDLIASNSRWRDMVDEVVTVQTQSFQIWLTKTAEEIGWAVDISLPGTAAERQFELMSSYVQPFDSWADMSQVLPTEDGGPAVKSVQYIFGPLEDAPKIPEPWTASHFPEDQTARAKVGMLSFLNQYVGALWPGGVSSDNPGVLDWRLLVDPNGASGAKRVDAQFWRANVEPSERYVLSVAGTAQYRMHPANSGFTNLYLAGDWTDNGFNVGCVEAAALSAKLAASGISGSSKDAEFASRTTGRTSP